MLDARYYNHLGSASLVPYHLRCPNNKVIDDVALVKRNGAFFCEYGRMYGVLKWEISSTELHFSVILSGFQVRATPQPSILNNVSVAILISVVQ